MNKYSFNNGKKERIITKVSENELPTTEATKELWRNHYKSNINFNRNSKELKELLN